MRTIGVSVLILTLAILVLFLSTQGVVSPVETPLGTISPELVAVFALIVIVVIIFLKRTRDL